MAQLADAQGNWEQVKENYRKALDICKKLGDDFKLSTVCLEFYMYSEVYGDHDLAVECNNKIIEIEEKNGEIDKVIRHMIISGDTYQNAGSIEKARMAFTDALKRAEEAQNNEAVVNIQGKLSSL